MEGIGSPRPQPAPARRSVISRSSGGTGTAGIMPVVTETKALRPWSGDRAPADWGLGDGQAVPWEYAPAPESRDIVTLKPRYGLFIDGREVPAADGGVFKSVDPATEEVIAEVAKATPADVDKAIRAARRAQKTRWGNLPGRERAKYLFRIARILQERSREFAVLESMDSGKPIKESRDVDVPLAANHFWYYAGWADKLEYAFPGRVARPLGVAAQVIPWNFPLLMLAWKIAPALAAGNTVVLKPASTTPLSALLFAEVVQQAELPPGVVNIVPGPSDIGMHLVSHPGVDKVAFTGSTGVGKLIQKATAGTDKALTLELGGKAANIVFEDAALDQAVEGIVNGIYFNQGEVCCAGSRLLVQESITGPLIEKLKDRLSTIRVGDPLDKNTDVGAINSKSQLEKITELVQAGVDEGAEIYQPACDLPDRGYFFRPTLFTNVAQSHRIAKEEIFGPVLSVLTFRTPDEAVEKANNTPYGLSAGVWTEKGSRILWMVRKLKAGVVWANTFNRFDPTSPFGGYKESGFGREGGMHGLHAYVRLEDR
jgi:aldehyde dehydrogenase (NAD+)